MVDTTAPQRTGPPPGAVVPRWVREALAGQSRALVLYVTLSELAGIDLDRPTGRISARRKLLAEELGGCSPDTLDRALDAVVQIGALTIEGQVADGGGQAPNDYIVSLIPMQAERKLALILPTPPPPRRVRMGSVYVVEAGGRIKIGYSAHLDARLGSLQRQSAYEITLVHAFPGTIVEEAALHRRFASCRIHGEWFEPNADMEAWLAELPR